MKKNRKKILVQINSVCNGSTGKIMGEIQRKANNFGFETISFYGRRKPFNDLKCENIGNKFSTVLHGAMTLLFNNHGMYSYFNTRKLIRRLKKINPDIIQLHNIHGYYLNYEILFNYLKNDFNGKIYWTLHDCWAFTGHCAYFDYVKCDKWKNQCQKCPQIRSYPSSIFLDTSKKEYIRKKNIFNGIKNLTIITPSKWLADLVHKSYLNYAVEVIYNGIDLKLFKPNYNNEILDKYSIQKNKKIILGVANIWEKRKGLDTFYKLSNDIDKNTIIVLVGLTRKQKKHLPDNIIGIERTDNQSELVELYSIADVFVNPTKEEVLGMTSIEAIACGTPVVTFKVGGCPEIIIGDVGYVCNDYEDLLIKTIDIIKNDYKKTIFNNKNVIRKFNSKKCYEQYIKLYNGSDNK